MAQVRRRRVPHHHVHGDPEQLRELGQAPTRSHQEQRRGDRLVVRTVAVFSCVHCIPFFNVHSRSSSILGNFNCSEISVIAQLCALHSFMFNAHSRSSSIYVYFSRTYLGEIDQSAGGNANCVCCILDSGIFLCNMKVRVTH